MDTKDQLKDTPIDQVARAWGWACRECIVLDTHQYLEKKMAQESDGAHDRPD